MAIASAKATDKIRIVLISEEASGLRPSASRAPLPINPTPIPGPIIPKPIAIAVAISFNSINSPPFMVFCSHHNKNRRQHCKNQGLDKPYKYFKTQKGNRNQNRHQESHDRTKYLTSKNIAKKTE